MLKLRENWKIIELFPLFRYFITIPEAYWSQLYAQPGVNVHEQQIRITSVG